VNNTTFTLPFSFDFIDIAAVDKNRKELSSDEQMQIIIKPFLLLQILAM
jgi:hypothetical protein